MGLSHPADGNFIMNGIAAMTAASAPAPAPVPAPAPAPAPPATAADPQLAKVGEQTSMVEKRNSLGRSGARFSSGRRVTPASAAARTSTPPPPHHQHTGSGAGQDHEGQQKQQHGVTLVDAPMHY
jgi:hypothetical protein